MSHLLAISVGPVQEFIAAARRTRDLWFGSYLLSEVSKAVAKSVRDQHGELIFPHPNTDLEPDPNVNVANVILAELGAADPKVVAAKAREAAQKRWLDFAKDARSEASGVIRADNIWQDQVDDVIEFYAAWVPLEDYQHDRARVMRLLAGRKNCRDFFAAKGRTGVRKSSLDGQRETVLKEGNREHWPKRLRLSDGEQLDAVGIVKRLAEGQRPYPSVARVAAETWLGGIEKQGKLERLKGACQKLVVKGLNSVREEKFKYFPFEGTVIFKDRHADLRKELALGDRDLDEVAAALKDIGGGEPNPYLAVLVADGDTMGEAISRLNSPQKHREFSQALARFADEARSITNAHNGVLVYAGGDDVLTFAPVDNCLSCARKLHDKFGALLETYTNAEGKSPTLSVGLAIGHFMENLEDLLDFGRTAEKAAKQPNRDGLAVHLHKRGGAPIKVRAEWTKRPDERITGYAKSICRDDLPGKLAYELRTLADLYMGWRKETEEEKKSIASAISQDVRRLLSKKQPESGKGMTLDVSHVKDWQSLKAFAEELLVARLIATALKQSREAES